MKKIAVQTDAASPGNANVTLATLDWIALSRSVLKTVISMENAKLTETASATQAGLVTIVLNPSSN